ncbi:hypothetical protein EDB85DRAFT_2145473 [Lactarius pseudohatsudake]|nr:hypothetical protein EDB85DRAFT_2145473 [Lactarius pseudohatsudake]
MAHKTPHAPMRAPSRAAHPAAGARVPHEVVHPVRTRQTAPSSPDGSSSSVVPSVTGDKLPVTDVVTASLVVVSATATMVCNLLSPSCARAEIMKENHVAAASPHVSPWLPPPSSATRRFSTTTTPLRESPALRPDIMPSRHARLRHDATPVVTPRHSLFPLTQMRSYDSVTLVIEASSHRLHTSRLASSLPGLPLTCVYAGHIVVAVSLAALEPTQMRPPTPATSPQSHTRTRCPSTVTLPPQRGRDTPAPLTRLPPRPHHAGATSTRSPLSPRYDASTSAAHLNPAAPAPSRHGHHRHLVHPTPPHGTVSTRPPPPPDSTRHTSTAATATSPLHLSPPHLYY